MRPKSGIPDRGRIIGLAISLALGLAAHGLYGQTDEELFARAFGTTKKLPTQEIALPVLLAGRPLGMLATRLAADGAEPQVRGAELVDLLRGLARPELVAALAAAAADVPMLPLSRLRELGLTLEVDAARLELYLELAAADRERVELALRQRGLPNLAGQRLTPARRSAFLNLRLAADLVREAGGAFSFQGERLELEPAADFAGTVFEGRLVFAPGTTTPLRRGELRLVHDRVEQEQRWLFGDLSYPVRGFQSFQPIFGVAVAKDFALDPYRVVQPLGELDFLVEAESRAEVLVNGRSERVLRLPAGSYRLSDFYLESGLNDIRLRLTDAAGRVRVLDLSLPFEPSILLPGLSSWAAAFGVAAEPAEAGARYRGEAPLASLLYRRGWSSTFTFGLGLQAASDRFLATTETVKATPFGAFSLNSACSGGLGQLGFAGRLDFERFKAGAANPRRRRWNVGLSWRGADFLPFGAPANPAGERGWQGGLQLRVLQRLGGRSTVGLAGSLERSSATRGQQGGLTLSWRRPLSRHTHLGLETSWRERAGEPAGLAVSWSLSLVLPRQNQQLRAAGDSGDRSSSLDWSYAPSSPVGHWSAAGALRRGEAGLDGTLEAEFTGDRGQAQLLFDAAANGRLEAGLRAAFSLAMTGDRWAIGRPIEGAFALLAPHPTLAGLDIGADRGAEGFAVSVRRFGGVVPDLAPYQGRTLAVEIADLPPGYDPGPGLFQLLPRYKSGILVPIGSGGVLALAGRLVDEAGAPIALRSGLAASPGADVPEEPKAFFTNRAGRFRIEGLRPGKLKLTLDDGRQLELELPEGQRGVIELGDLMLASGRQAA